MRLCVFEDFAVRDLEPLALTRPAFDLRCGARTLPERQADFLSAGEVGALVREEREGRAGWPTRPSPSTTRTGSARS
jgi:hypothetical protein